MSEGSKGETARIARLIKPKAAAYIVTVFGDVAIPRGGSLWTGTLIELCAHVGINESLVRTAVSRLVAASQLEGQRLGRRSYYCLNEAADLQFRQAADVIFGPVPLAKGWRILHDPALSPDEARRQRMGHMGGHVYIQPDRGQAAPASGLAFHAQSLAGSANIAQFWDLEALQSGYARFLALFQGLRADSVVGAQALALRLLLVHAYRFVILRDPHLGHTYLPSTWSASKAKDVFRQLYLDLSPAADRYIQQRCLGVDGPLAGATPATEERKHALSDDH